MNVVTTIEPRQTEGASLPPKARIGMIIPSVNSMTEPQFHRFAPPGLGDIAGDRLVLVSGGIVYAPSLDAPAR